MMTEGFRDSFGDEMEGVAFLGMCNDDTDDLEPFNDS